MNIRALGIGNANDYTTSPNPCVARRLTVKLRGRTTTSERRRGPTISPGTRGAKPTTPHGPLQRLLGGGCMSLLNRRHLKYRVRMIVGNMGMHELTS